MPAFSLTDAAFEGFRLTREKPRVVGAWALLYALMSVVTGVLMIFTIGPQFATLRAAARGAAPTDPAEAMRQFRVLAPFFMIVAPLVLIFWSVLTCAVYRAILRPREGGFGRLRFGADELRMMGLTIVIWLMMFATIFLATLLIGLGGLLGAAGGMLSGFISNLISLVALGAAFFVWVRLSLAGPMTFVTGEIHVFRSWALTKGHFWRLAAVYGLAVSLAIVVSLLALVIFSAVAGILVMASGRPLSDVGHVFETNTASLASYFTPAQLFYEAFSAVLQVVVYAVLLSPAAVIHAALAGRPVDT